MNRREAHATAFELVWRGSRSELLAHGLDVAGVRGLDIGASRVQYGCCSWSLCESDAEPRSSSSLKLSSDDIHFVNLYNQSSARGLMHRVRKLPFAEGHITWNRTAKARRPRAAPRRVKFARTRFVQPTRANTTLHLTHSRPDHRVSRDEGGEVLLRPALGPSRSPR